MQLLLKRVDIFLLNISLSLAMIAADGKFLATSLANVGPVKIP